MLLKIVLLQIQAMKETIMRQILITNQIMGRFQKMKQSKMLKNTLNIQPQMMITKVDPNQSNSKEYYITFTAHDATGYPMKAATTVNKQTGHVNGYIDRRTKADRENIFNMLMKVRHIKGPDSNNRKAFGKDLSHPNYNDQNEQQSQNENNQQNQTSEDQSQQESNNDDSSQSKEGTSETEAAQNRTRTKSIGRRKSG